MNKLSIILCASALTSSLNGVCQFSQDYQEIRKDTIPLSDSTSLVNVYAKTVLLHRGTLDNSGQRTGEWETYFYNQQPRIKAQFSNGLAQGSCVYYYSDGTTQALTAYTKGKPTGYWRSFYPNGNKQAEIVWSDELNQPLEVRLYHKKGPLALQKTYTYSNAKAKIKIKSFYSNGAPFEAYRLYRDHSNIYDMEKILSSVPHLGITQSLEGKLSGYYTRNYVSGRPWVQLLLESDSLKEIIYQYDPNKEIIPSQFADGLGLLSMNHHNGDPAVEANYKSGLKDGEFKLFYKEHNTRTVGEYSKGRKMGTWEFSSFSGKKKSEHKYSKDSVEIIDYGPKNRLYRKYTTVNGIAEGHYVTYDFFGDTTSICNYQNGFLEGEFKSYFRNNLLRKGNYHCSEQVGVWTTKGQFNEVSYRTSFIGKQANCNDLYIPKAKIKFEDLILIPSLLKNLKKEASTYNPDAIILTENQVLEILLSQPDSDEIWGTSLWNFKIDPFGRVEKLVSIKDYEKRGTKLLGKRISDNLMLVPSFKNGFPISPELYIEINNFR